VNNESGSHVKNINLLDTSKNARHLHKDYYYTSDFVINDKVKFSTGLSSFDTVILISKAILEDVANPSDYDGNVGNFYDLENAVNINVQNRHTFYNTVSAVRKSDLVLEKSVHSGIYGYLQLMVLVFIPDGNGGFTQGYVLRNEYNEYNGSFRCQLTNSRLDIWHNKEDCRKVYTVSDDNHMFNRYVNVAMSTIHKFKKTRSLLRNILNYNRTTKRWEMKEDHFRMYGYGDLNIE